MSMSRTRRLRRLLHDTAFHTRALGATREIQCILESFGDRLFEIDVFACRHRRTRTHGPTAGGVRVEMNRNSGVGVTRVAIGAPIDIAVLRRYNRKLCPSAV